MKIIKLLLTICLSYLIIGCGDKVLEQDKNQVKDVYLPMSVGNTWEYEVLTTDSKPEKYEKSNITSSWEIKSFNNSDSTAVMKVVNSGIKIKSQWNDSLKIDVHDTSSISNKYEFQVTIKNGLMIFKNDGFDLKEFCENNNVTYTYKNLDSLSISDIRGSRSKPNFLKLKKNIGIVEKFRDDGFAGIYSSSHLKLIKFNSN